jgi:serine/threonine protein kinase
MPPGSYPSANTNSPAGVMPWEEGSCPGAMLIEVYASGGSGDAVLDTRLSEHVKRCTPCATMLDDVQHNNNFLTDYKQELAPHGQLFEDPGEALTFPGYRVLGEVHRGAQGIVYRAIQESTRRTVALKVLLQGAFATSRQRARFEREAEVAAQLVHPNIVTVFDTMAARAGRLAIVMEYVEGRTLDTWCLDLRKALGTTAQHSSRVLDVFMPLCAAVHYAHQRGVIHRDLKPANIIVDANDRPRVLDFGIAKLTSGSEALFSVDGHAAMTRAGEFAGTLAYAAPEQLRGDSAHIDVRADVYALGVILYEMLTGAMPYDITGGVATIIDRVMNHEPRPAMLVNPHLDDDISTLLARALAKEPHRRYQSAAELLKDLERYRAGEAIDAKRDSTFYVVGKWAKRRRPLVIGATIATIAALAGAGMGLYALAERASREELEIAKQLETESRLAAEQSRQTADQQRQAADTAKEALGRILTSISPGASRGRQVSVRYMLASAERELTNLATVPGPPQVTALVQAEVRYTLGCTYTQLGDLTRAQEHLERAVQLYEQAGRGNTLTFADALEAYGKVLGIAGDSAAGEDYILRSLTLRRELAGESSAEAASSLNTLGAVYVHHARFDQAKVTLSQALAIRSTFLPRTSPDLTETKALLAQSLWQSSQPDFDAAKQLFQESLVPYQPGEDHPAIADCTYQLAHLLTASGNYPQALELAQNCAQMRERLFGNDHSTLAHALDLEAGLLAITGEQRAAAKVLERSLTIYRSALQRTAPDNPGAPQRSREYADTVRLMATTAANLGRIYYKIGNYESAVPVLLEWHAQLDILRSLPPVMRPLTMGGMGVQTLEEETQLARACLYQVYTDMDRPEDALKWAED